MSEAAKDQEPRLTETQQRFLGFVGAHVHSVGHKSETMRTEQGVYHLVDDRQLFPIGDIVFARITKVVHSKEETESKVVYRDTKENRLLVIALEIDAEGRAVDADARDPDKAFFVTYGGRGDWGKEGDSLAAQLIDRFELLEGAGVIVPKAE